MDTFDYGSFRYATFMGIAQELAETPRAQYDVTLQELICNRHGLSLDDMTEDEMSLIGQMATDYGRKIYD